MFTLNQIKEAHAKVKSGADFPKYIQDLLQLGILRYSTYVIDGHTEFIGVDNYALISGDKYDSLLIANESDTNEFKNYLKLHQQGQSDFLTFCKQAAQTGIEKWVTDITYMTCTYYDTKGNEVLVETIPSA
ncbi:DUF1398 domain-containing protein [Emticicia fontis]